MPLQLHLTAWAIRQTLHRNSLLLRIQSDGERAIGITFIAGGVFGGVRACHGRHLIIRMMRIITDVGRDACFIKIQRYYVADSLGLVRIVLQQEARLSSCS